MKFLMVLRDFMYSRENAYYILILTQQFQLLPILCEVSILHAMFVRLVFSELLSQPNLEILQQWIVSNWLLYLTLSILISLILQSYILLDFFLFVEVLEHGNDLIYVFSFEFGGHRQIMLEHMYRLGLLRVYLLCTGRMLPLWWVLILEPRWINRGALGCMGDHHDRPR